MSLGLETLGEVLWEGLGCRRAAGGWLPGGPVAGKRPVAPGAGNGQSAARHPISGAVNRGIAGLLNWSP